jgi:hypothetical protein
MAHDGVPGRAADARRVLGDPSVALRRGHGHVMRASKTWGESTRLESGELPRRCQPAWRMAPRKISVQLVVCADDGPEATLTAVAVLEKACQRLAPLGLTRGPHAGRLYSCQPGSKR